MKPSQTHSPYRVLDRVIVGATYTFIILSIISMIFVYPPYLIISTVYLLLGWVGALAIGIPTVGFFLWLLVGVTYPQIREHIETRRAKQEAILEAKIDSMVEAKLEALKDDTEEK